MSSVCIISIQQKSLLLYSHDNFESTNAVLDMKYCYNFPIVRRETLDFGGFLITGSYSNHPLDSRIFDCFCCGFLKCVRIYTGVVVKGILN